MKVCLIDPILFSFQQVRGRSLKNNVGMSFYPPLGLCYIANYLRKNGAEVVIIDRKVLMTKKSCSEQEVNELTMERLKQFDADIVGITITTPTMLDVKRNILKLVRQSNERALIAVGGPHVSAVPEDLLENNPEIDVACRGEGEGVMLDLLRKVPFKDIAGLTYRDGDRIVNNECRKPHKNVDEFCFPARDLLDMEFYERSNPYVMHGLYMRSTTILTSRGCPYNCTFCAGQVASGRIVRYQSPELVVEEIESLIGDYRMEGLYFADDMFDADKTRARTICHEIIRKKLNKKMRWNAQMRANSVDKDLLRLMKEAGCIRVDVGFESGSQKTLDVINKKTTVAQNYNAAKILHELGLQIHANIIVGIPGESTEDLQMTKKFVEDIKPTWIGFGEFIPLPGSELFNKLLAEKIIAKENAENLKCHNFTNVDDVPFDNFIKQMRRRIVIPTRIKSYIAINRSRPSAYAYLLRLMLNYVTDSFRKN